MVTAFGVPPQTLGGEIDILEGASFPVKMLYVHGSMMIDDRRNGRAPTVLHSHVNHPCRGLAVVPHIVYIVIVDVDDDALMMGMYVTACQRSGFTLCLMWLEGGLGRGPGT